MLKLGQIVTWLLFFNFKREKIDHVIIVYFTDRNFVKFSKNQENVRY